MTGTPFHDRPHYKWLLVGMLWLVCFFNYADRQAIFSLFPLLHSELKLSDVQLGVVGSAFMWMYALVGPVAGWLCDRLPRKTLVLGGLLFWSLITAASAASHSYAQLVTCRALGGLGEAFYFPAAMSLLSDFHGNATRSRAMALHQSGVYAGSIAGGAVSGWLGQMYGWRSSFIVFGGLGLLLGAVLWRGIHEVARGCAEPVSDPAVLTGEWEGTAPATHGDDHSSGVLTGIADVFRRPVVLVLIAVFMGANFVAVVFLTWLPTFLFEKFHMSLAMAGLNGTAYLQMASVLGVIGGGFLADAATRRPGRVRSGESSSGGRMTIQALGLLCGVPFLFVAGHTFAVPVLLTAIIGFGFFKGIYDASLWASLYDVVPLRRRGSALGIMNSLGWLGGGAAPVLIALAARRIGMSAAISATSAIYLCIGLLLLVTARSFMRKVTL